MSGRGRGKRSVIKPTEEPIETPIKEEKPKKTTKKKQFPVVATVGPDGIKGSLLTEVRRPLIIHLPIQSRDVPNNDMPVIYDPRPPTEAMPYDMHLDNPFYETVESLESQNNTIITPLTIEQLPIKYEQHKNNEAVTTTTNTSTNIQETEIDYYNIKSSLLVQFKDATEVKTIPQTSDVACFWCCHTFTNRPVVLPVRDTGESLTVTGNFCSPECACAYLFDMRQDAHTRWEQCALLYRVYGEACNSKIHPAPARNILKHFGGNLSIQEYRQLIRSHKVRIDIHLPPMVSILATMDTKPIDFYDASLTKGVTETVKERLQKAEEVLRLRRTKPLKAWESTLDACINLKIKA